MFELKIVQHPVTGSPFSGQFCIPVCVNNLGVTTHWLTHKGKVTSDYYNYPMEKFYYKTLVAAKSAARAYCRKNKIMRAVPVELNLV